MKKLGFFGLTLALASLVGCSPSSGGYTVPTTPYQKVKTAFSGVEKSFRNVSSGQNKLIEKNLLMTDSSTILDSLYGLLTEQDNQGDVIDDLSYTQPPMIQFQCLKYVYESVGENFSFNTKYYDNITGKVYIDFNSGLEAEHKSEYEYNYDFGLSLLINIDENDLITADVGFDITVSKGNDSYHTSWYVNMALDYDMNKESPTYTLAMLTNNDERDIPYFNRCTYEYDYVEVNDNKIVEWRKFDMEAPIVLVKDASHQSFDTYIREGTDYVVGSFAWYKNNMLKKAQNIKKEDRKAQVANLFYDLGLNSTDIDSVPFFRKEGTKNNIIKTMYQEFSNIFKKDIIYSLIVHDDAEGEVDDTPRYLKILNFMGGAEISENDECFLEDEYATFSNIVTAVSSFSKESPFIPVFNLYNQNDEFIREAEVSDLTVKVFISDTNKVDVNMTDKVSDIVNQYHLPILKAEYSLMVDKGIADSKVLNINCNPLSESLKGWPYEKIEEMGLSRLVPPFATSSYYASVINVNYQSDRLAIEITLDSVNDNDITNYQEKLEALGYGHVGKDVTYLFADTSRNLVFQIRLEGSGNVNMKIEKTTDYFCSYSPEDKAIFSELHQDVLLPEGTVFNHPNGLSNFFDYYGVSSKAFNDFKARLLEKDWKEHDNASDPYKLYYDYNDFRHCIDYLDTGDNALRLVYTSRDIPAEKLDFAELVLNDETRIPMGNDTENNLFAEYSFYTGQSFYISGGKGGSIVTLNYSHLEQNITASKYLAKGNNNTISVKTNVQLKVKIITDKNVFKIVCTDYQGGGGSGGEDTPTHSYSLVGGFNNWDSNKGIALTYDGNGVFYIQNFSFTKGVGFVILEDNSWNNSFGFSDLDKSYDEYVKEGKTNGIDPIVDFSCTIKFYNSKIYLENISTSGEGGGGETSEFGFNNVALVGSFNDWNEKDTTYEFSSRGTTYSIELDLSQDDQFKIVFDHSWEGSYGYDNVPAFSKQIDFFGREAEHQNVICLQDMHILITIALDNGSLVFNVVARAK